MKETIDALISTGLADLGYVYVNIDDCWSFVTRDSEGQLVPAPKTFPSGIKTFADYIHGKGSSLAFVLMLGHLHRSSTFHEKDDASLLSSWIGSELNGKMSSIKPTALRFYGRFNVTVTGITIQNNP